MDKVKKCLLLRNKDALDTNQNLESVVGNLLMSINANNYRNDLATMAWMLKSKSEEITFDIYTIECLIHRAKKPMVLEWCEKLIESIEKKILLLDNSCNVMKALISKEEGVAYDHEE
jgi:hypothetical protein